MTTRYTAESASLTAENTFSDPITARKGTIELALSGTWVATVSVQKRYRDETTWFTIDRKFTGNGVWIGENEIDDCDIRFGIETGNYTSGTVVGHICQITE